MGREHHRDSPTLIAQRLVSVRVETLMQAEWMRQLRNAGIGGFTSHNAPITPEQQVTWWQANHRRVRAWLYYLAKGEGGFHSAPLGYGLVRADQRRQWFSFAVDPFARGHGVGTHIARDVPSLAWLAGIPAVHSLVRADNQASLRAHQKAGVWQGIGEGDDGHSLLVARKPR